MLGLPDGREAAGRADVPSNRVNDLPALMRGSLTWEQGTDMVRHAQPTVATDLPVYFAHPHSPRTAPPPRSTIHAANEVFLTKGKELY